MDTVPWHPPSLTFIHQTDRFIRFRNTQIRRPRDIQTTERQDIRTNSPQSRISLRPTAIRAKNTRANCILKARVWLL